MGIYLTCVFAIYFPLTLRCENEHGDIWERLEQIGLTSIG